LPEAGTRHPRPRDDRSAAVRPASPTLLRTTIATLLAVPVLASIYLGPLARRAAFVRPVLVVAVGALLTFATYGATPAPAPLVANPGATPSPRAVARIGAAVVTGHGLAEGLGFDFTQPMNPATVERALTVAPVSKIQLAWSTDGRNLNVRPAASWRPATAYTLRIGSEARDLRGQPLANPVEATFVTRPAVAAKLTVIGKQGSRVALDARVEIRFSRPVQAASVARAFTVSPRAAGRLAAVGANPAGLATRLTWRPSSPLRPGVAYRFRLRGAVLDEDGLSARAAAALNVRTLARPAVVRFRPARGATGVDRNALISVRFTERMNRSSAQRAFAMVGLNAARSGTFRWVENDTVLVFDPRSPLAAGRRYTVTVSGSAKSAAGVSLKSRAVTALRYSFRTEKPATAAAPTPKRAPKTSSAAATRSAPAAPRPTGGGGNWAAVERYVLRLVNCIRTGGTLQSDGDCSGYGSGKNGGYRKPLTLHAGISTKVARPYAKYLATRAACNHFLIGNPGTRLRRAGYTSYRWAENLGCRTGNPYTAVLGSHLYFQSEKPYSGGHWVNLKNPDYTTVGIGVWVSNGNVRVVTNFYDP
jgi:hypothetical protein